MRIYKYQRFSDPITFSSPSKTYSSREAEREAILFIYNAFFSQIIIQGSLLINADCLILVDDFQRKRIGYIDEDCPQMWLDIVGNPN